MKRTEITSLTTKSNDQLQKQLTDLQDQLTTAYLQRSAGKLKNISIIKTLKADIARVKTVQNALSSQQAVA